MIYNKKMKAGEYMIIAIIGGGASGMAAALAAAENPNVTVELFERQGRVGRKLQATGNGRCNLTNMHACTVGYHGEDPSFSEAALSVMGPVDTLVWFRKLGLFTVEEPSGRVYPYSDQANSVVDVLRFALEKPNIHLHLGAEVLKIKRTGEEFSVESAEEKLICDKVIIACGGLAGTKLGGSMAGYKLLTKLGHKSTRLRPALVQLKCSWSGISALKGVRANCNAKILRNGALRMESTGELQFTEYGLSGPVIFEVSRDACVGVAEWVCRLDFLPQISENTLYLDLLNRKNRCLPADELLTGILHNRLGRTLIKAAGIRSTATMDMVSEQEIRAVCKLVKAFDIPITEPLGMDAAQVTAGGIVTKDFNPETMESYLVPGLYACGEVLDVDGDCGGYNLQWAWSSGYCAGSHAGKEQL